LTNIKKFDILFIQIEYGDVRVSTAWRKADKHGVGVRELPKKLWQTIKFNRTSALAVA